MLIGSSDDVCRVLICAQRFDRFSSRFIERDWRLDSRSARTLGGSIFKIEYQLPSWIRKSSQKKTYRNPLIYAMELADEMKKEGLTQTELARKYGISRARVNQWMALIKLPEGEKRRLVAMGDYWDYRLETERNIRKLLHEDVDAR